MAQATKKSHLPYAIRYMARLQEQAAQTCESDSKSEGLKQEAQEMRVAVRSLEHNPAPSQNREATVLTQKIKLINWLRQSK